MRFLQLLIVFGVLASNVHWKWTPNGYLAAIVAGLAVWITTVLPVSLWRKLLRFKAKSRLRQKQLSKGLTAWPASAQGGSQKLIPQIGLDRQHRIAGE